MPNFLSRSSIPHSGRMLTWRARSATNTTAAWVITPSVVPMPSTRSLAVPIATGSMDSSPGTSANSPSVTRATMLLTTGAQAGGPNTLRVLRIAMNTDDRP